MSNHYHLLVETPQANPVAGMRWFQTTWTMRFNRRPRLSGHLFQERYKSVVEQLPAAISASAGRERKHHAPRLRAGSDTAFSRQISRQGEALKRAALAEDVHILLEG